MPLDLTKLTDAVAKVADLAKAHADTTALVSAAIASRDVALASVLQAQTDIDNLAAQLMASATTPAEAAGIAAVASALSVPAPATDAPAQPAESPVAPVAAAPATTFLPGDPRAPKA